MLKIDRDGRSIERLSVKSLHQAGILERRDLQQMIVNNPDSFFEEMGERLVLIGREICPSDYVGDRIDLLAVDTKGQVVVIELKRFEYKLQLLQALSYVAMLADWNIDRFVATRSQFANEPPQAAIDTIRDHVRPKILDDLNRVQRVILVAEAFDFSLLKTAEWLSDTYGVGIRCYRIEYVSDGSAEYISCACIFPPADIVDNATRVRKDSTPALSRTSTSWADLMNEVKNADVRALFEKSYGDSEKRLGSRDMAFRIKGDRRLYVGVRRNHAYVWQSGRFEGDLVYWRNALSTPLKVQPVENGGSLSFILKTAGDVIFFEQSLCGKLQNVSFLEQDSSPFLDDSAILDENSETDGA